MSCDEYRSCASIVVLRKAQVCSPDGCGDIHEVLLVHKPRKKDSWQLPQGGVEAGESIEEAALRELKEETNIEARIIGTTTEKYQYDFPKSFRRFRPDNVCGQCIEFVIAMKACESQVQVDGEEIDGFLWVLPEEIGKYIKRKEYLQIVQRLVKEATSLAVDS